MRRIAFFSLLTLALLSGCGGPVAPTTERAVPPPSATLNEAAPTDSLAARGGNMMGSGH